MWAGLVNSTSADVEYQDCQVCAGDFAIWFCTRVAHVSTGDRRYQWVPLLGSKDVYLKMPVCCAHLLAGEMFILGQTLLCCIFVVSALWQAGVWENRKKLSTKNAQKGEKKQKISSEFQKPNPSIEGCKELLRKYFPSCLSDSSTRLRNHSYHSWDPTVTFFHLHGKHQCPTILPACLELTIFKPLSF